MKKFEGYMHGVNIGGWLSQCDYSPERLNNFIKEEDIKRLSEWDIDHIRVPFDYNILEKKNGICYLDDIVFYAATYGLNIILDFHKTWGFCFDDKEREEGFFESEKYQEKFYKTWEMLALRYNNNPIVAFELLNEVTDFSYNDKWCEIANTCIKRIRAINKNVKILVGGCENNSALMLKYLNIIDDENIVYNFHCYEPLIFTHQGGYWVKGMNADFRMDFDDSVSNYIAYSNENTAVKPNIAEYTNKEHIDHEYFENLFKDAIEFVEKKNAYIYCGEYGVIALAGQENLVKWLKCINEVFEKYNIGRAIWCYKGMDFGIGDPLYKNYLDEIIKLL